MFMTFGFSVVKEHAVFINKYNEDFSTKLIETSQDNQIYDFESYDALYLIFLKTFYARQLRSPRTF